MNTKQVIVIRRDLNMRKGKLAAQASHASMAFLTKEMEVANSNDGFVFHTEHFNTDKSLQIQHWLKNSFRKICVYVDSELELDDLHQRALDKGMISHMIEDNGATEFNGVKTKTCIAIGPAEDSKFFGLTDHLPLL
jgi:peptidyl-tRNA hydrolase, PTH2 family